jgi:hypothetical protein
MQKHNFIIEQQDGQLQVLEFSVDNFDSIDLSQGVRKGPHKRPPSRNRAKRQSDRRSIERKRYGVLEDNFRIYCQNALKDIKENDYDEKSIRRFSKALYDYQTRQYMLGRKTGGSNLLSLSEEEKRYLHGQHAMEMKYFRRFVRAMRSGTTKMPEEQRIDLYGLGGYSIYLRGFLSSYPNAKDLLFLWDLGVAEHCEDCVKRFFESRAKGGYTVKDLFGRVGLPSEKTRCRHRCKCKIRVKGTKMNIDRTRPTNFKHIIELMERDNG